MRFKAHLKPSGFYLTEANGDTLVKNTSDHYRNYRLHDFNRDGYKDILLEWASHGSDTYTLYLFDPTAAGFTEVRDFSDYPAALPVNGTRYYYSYKRNGCGDDSWISDLFYIKNFVAVRAGRIRGDGCGVKDGIFIYRVKHRKEILATTLPLDVLSDYKEYKWGFIRQYWKKNLARFK